MTTMPRWATTILATMGVVMVAAMFVNWVDVNGQIEMNGWRFAWDTDRWLLLVPVVGAALVAAASTRSRHTRLAAVLAGALVAGDVLYDLSKDLVHADLATWLVLGGAGAILAGLGKDGRGWRIGGGLAVLAGFFAPWTHNSLYGLLTDDLARTILDHMGVTVRVLWLIPLAAIGGIVAGLDRKPSGGRLALASGVAIYGAFLWLIGSAANVVLAWGAWATLAASAVALVLGVLASGPVIAKAAVRPAKA
jgi:hypothetical protein